jgi:uncharacterized protein (TIGR03066 family)
MRALAAVAAVWCSVALAAPVPKDRAEAEKVVGTWRMTLDSQGKSDTNLTLEIHQSGKFVIRQVLPDGREIVYEGTYSVKGNEMPYSVSRGDFKKAETLTIKKLTATELVVVDPDGLKEEFARVKPPEPKKDEKK